MVAVAHLLGEVLHVPRLGVLQAALGDLDDAAGAASVAGALRHGR